MGVRPFRHDPPPEYAPGSGGMLKFVDEVNFARPLSLMIPQRIIIHTHGFRKHGKGVSTTHVPAAYTYIHMYVIC